MKRPAAFLDRDGTIIEDVHYLADPAQVALIPGALEGLRVLRADGYALVIVSNQSGIARGLYGVAELRAVQERLELLLARGGVALDAVLYCPHHPDFTGPCECRKPGAGMYREAAAMLGLDLAASVYVGDRVSDVSAALTFGGRGILVRTGYGAAEEARVPAEVSVVEDLRAAARLVTGVDTRRDPG